MAELKTGIAADKKMIVKGFLAEQKGGVVSTLYPDNGGIESAYVQITLADDALNIIFDSLPESRKNKNLAKNPRVALVTGWDENITVQIEGMAKRIDSKNTGHLGSIHVKNNPGESSFVGKGTVLYIITPKRIKYSDFRNDPPTIIELSDKDLPQAT